MGKISANWVEFAPRQGRLLRFTFVIGFNGLCDVQAQVPEFEAQCLSGDSQEPGCFMLATAGVFKDTGQQESIHLAMCLGVQVANVGLQPLTDESLKLQICIRRGGCVRRGD